MTEDDITQALEDCLMCEDADDLFDEWEHDFLQDINDQWNIKNYLSIKQEDVLRKLWSKTKSRDADYDEDDSSNSDPFNYGDE